MEQRETIMKLTKLGSDTKENRQLRQTTNTVRKTPCFIFPARVFTEPRQPYNKVFVRELDFYDHTPVMADVMQRGGERQPLCVEETAWKAARRSPGTVRGGHGVRPDTVAR